MGANLRNFVFASAIPSFPIMSSAEASTTVAQAPEDLSTDVLVFVRRDIWLRPRISRVVTHTQAITLYSSLVDPATGRIRLGRILPPPSRDVHAEVFRASAIGLPSELTDRLLSLCNQLVDGYGWFQTGEGYWDWLYQWQTATADAFPFIPAALTH